MRYTWEGEDQILENTYKKEYKCYRCQFRNTDKIHTDKEHKDYHKYNIAKYVLVTGETKNLIKIKLKDAVKKFSSSENLDGNIIKIFIGTEVIKEGVDFKNVRQLFLLDMWHNKAWYEQVIGRAIRYCSHIDLDKEYRNVTIFNLATSLKNSKDKKLKYTETEDERRYRRTEIKDYLNKKVERVLKRVAIDCIQNKNKNIINNNKKLYQISANGEKHNIIIKDNPFSPECDYLDKCNYKCIWEPKSNKNIKINTNTYDLFFNKIESKNILEIINKLYKTGNAFTIKKIISFIKNNIDNIENKNIFKTIDNIIKYPKYNIITDKFMRKGYLIYRGIYYIWQPFDIKYEKIPLLYRNLPFSNKTKSISLDLLNDYVEENKEKIKIDKSLIYKKIMKKITNNFKLYNHLKKYDISKDYRAFTYSVVQNIILKENLDNIIIFIKDIIVQYINKSKEKIIDDIIFYLDDKFLIKYDRELTSKPINNINIYGFNILDKYLHYNLKTKKWNNADKSNIYKIKQFKKFKQEKKEKLINNNIMGAYIKNNKNKILFQILDNSLYRNVITQKNKVSKRSIITGRVCSTYKIKSILEIHKKLNIEKHKNKKTKIFLCNEIEIYLFINQYNKTKNKKWFSINF